MEDSLGVVKKRVFGSVGDLHTDLITGKPPPYGSRKAYKQVFGSRGDLFNSRASGKLAELRTLSSSVDDLSERKAEKNYGKSEVQHKAFLGTSPQHRRHSSWFESTTSREESEMQRSASPQEPQDFNSITKAEAIGKIQAPDRDMSGDEGTSSQGVKHHVTVTRQTSWEHNFSTGLKRLTAGDKKWSSQESIESTSRRYFLPKHQEPSDSEEDSPKNPPTHRQYSSLELLINDDKEFKKMRQRGREKAKLQQTSSHSILDGKGDEDQQAGDLIAQMDSIKQSYAETPKAPTTSNNQAKFLDSGRIASTGRPGDGKDLQDQRSYHKNYTSTYKEATGIDTNSQMKNTITGEIPSSSKRGHVEDVEDHRDYLAPPREAARLKPNSQTIDQEPIKGLSALNGESAEDQQPNLLTPREPPTTAPSMPTALPTLAGEHMEDQQPYLSTPQENPTAATTATIMQAALVTLVGERLEDLGDRRSYLTKSELWNVDVGSSPSLSALSTLRGDESKSEGQSGSISPSLASTTSSLSSFSPYIPKAKQPPIHRQTFDLHTALPVYVHDSPPHSPPLLPDSTDAVRAGVDSETETEGETEIEGVTEIKGETENNVEVSTLTREVLHLSEMKQEIQAHLLLSQEQLKKQVQTLTTQLEEEQRNKERDERKSEGKTAEMEREIERLRREVQRQTELREKAEKAQQKEREKQKEGEGKEQKGEEEGWSAKNKLALKRKDEEIESLKLDLEHQKQHYLKSQGKLQRRVNDLQQEHRNNLEELSKNRRQLISLRSQLDERERKVEEREREVQEREKKVEEGGEKLEKREREMEGREVELVWKEGQLIAREKDVEEREKELMEREREMEGQEKELEGRQKVLEGRDELGRKEKELQGRERKLEAKEKELEEKKRQLEKWARELESKEKELERRMRELEGREKKLAGRERESEGRMRELKGRERESEGRERELERRERELERREKEVERRGVPLVEVPTTRETESWRKEPRKHGGEAEVIPSEAERLRGRPTPLVGGEVRGSAQLRVASADKHNDRIRRPFVESRNTFRNPDMSSWASESSLSKDTTDSNTRILKIRKSYEDLTAAANAVPQINKRRSADTNKARKATDVNKTSPTAQSPWPEGINRSYEAQNPYARVPSQAWAENHQQITDSRLKTDRVDHVPCESVVQLTQEPDTMNKPNFEAQKPYSKPPSHTRDGDHQRKMNTQLKTGYTDSSLYDLAMQVTKVDKPESHAPGSAFRDSGTQTPAFSDSVGNIKSIRGQQENSVPEPAIRPAPPVIVQLHAKGTLGLPNLGNTSYINSVMQCLFNIDTLRLYFSQLNQRCGALMEAVADVFEAMGKGTRVREAMNRLKVEVESRDKVFRLHPHPPAPHLLSALLAWMHADLTETTPQGPHGLTTSVISGLFHGLRELVVVCPIKSRVLSSVAECFSSLTLTVPGSGQIALEKMLSLRFSPKEIPWDCQHCTCQHTCQHLTTLRHLPDVLVVTLARSGEVKSEGRQPARVTFPLTGLSLNNHMTQDARSRPVYHLSCVIQQEGQGQYSSFCRSRQGRWWRWRDLQLDAITPDYVTHLNNTPVLIYATQH